MRDQYQMLNTQWHNPAFQELKKATLGSVNCDVVYPKSIQVVLDKWLIMVPVQV